MYIKNNGVREVFLSVLPLDNATAVGCLEAIEEELEKHGLFNLAIFQSGDWYQY
jgi:hypothetical protein